MAFTIEDFQDLIRVLDQHPEWRAELRRHVLSDEVLELPGIVRQMADHLAALTQRVDQLAERLDQLTERLDQLTERVDQLTARVDQLTQRVDQLTQQVDQLTQRVDQLADRLDQLTQRVDRLAERVDQLTTSVTLLERVQQSMGQDVADLKGMALEDRYRERPFVHLSRVVKRARTLTQDEIYRLLDPVVVEGRLTEADVEQILQADAIVRGGLREDDSDVYLAVEVSRGVGPGDVDRAFRRAELLRRAGLPARGVVAGTWITPEAEKAARSAGVEPVAERREDAAAERREG